MIEDCASCYTHDGLGHRGAPSDDCEKCHPKFCAECNAHTALLPFIHTQRVGAYTVTDSTRRQPQCDDLSHTAISLRDLSGYERRAALTILRATQGIGCYGLLKFVRKSLGMTVQMIAPLWEVSDYAYEQMEKHDERIPRSHVFALIGLLTEVERFDGQVDQMMNGWVELKPTLDLEVK